MLYATKFVCAGILLAVACNIYSVHASGITVTIFKHANFGGARRDIFIEDNHCFPLFGKWADDVSSIKLNNFCVQIYDGGFCDGKSEILDGNRPNSPSTTYANNLATINFNDKVRSLRHCV